MTRTILILAALFIFIGVTGFDTANSIVPRNDILSGGPPKDGIPALLKPEFVSAGQADFVQDDDHVIGVLIGSQARAYPIKILNWHEAVNDTVADQPLVVTF